MKLFIYALTGMLSAFIGTSLFAANANTPLNVQWSVDVDQRRPNAPAALSMPTLVSHDGDAWIVLSGRDGWAHIYDLKGKEVRRIYLGSPSDSGALTLTNGWVVVGDNTGRLLALDPVKGEIVWQSQLTGSFTSAPVAVGQDMLVQTTDNRIYRFSQAGEKQWSYAGQGSVLSMYLSPSPMVDGERVFALLNNGDAVALKADSGDLIWKRQLLLSNDTAILTDLKAPLSSPILVSSLYMDGEKSSDTLLMPIYQGDLVAVSAKDGSQSFSLPISLKATPIVLGSTLYAAESSGFLHAYNIEKGNRLWSKKITADELSGPVVFQDSLWLTDNKGMIYQVNLNGEVQASVGLAGNISRQPLVTTAGLLVRTDRGAMYMVGK